MRNTISTLFTFLITFTFILITPDHSSARSVDSEFSGSPNIHQIKPDTLHVLNYNIRYGRGMDGVVDIRRIADVIRESGADLVALQEVDIGVERSFGFDLMKILSGYTGLEPVFYKNIDHQGGEYGNGILSRFPIQTSRNDHIMVEGDREQRGLLQTEVLIGDQKIVFMNTHLDHRPDDTQRLAGVEQIIDTKQAYSRMPVIIAGDFNDTPGSRTHKSMKQYFEDAWETAGEGNGYTHSSDNPNKRIDYIFYSNRLSADNGKKLRLISIEVLDTQASDHLPVLAVFVLE